MPLRSVESYLESLRRLNLKIYLFGERVANWVDHPIIRPSINACAMTYALAAREEYRDLMVARSNLTGREVNRFTHLHQSTHDLVAKVKALRLLGRKTGACFQRCVGYDAINALDSTTYEVDAKYGTEYHRRLRAYVRYIQENDLVVDGGMTDAKGDRGLRPGQQADPDLYLRVVREKEDGIIVRGAKCHQTGAVNSHEVIAMPTVALTPEDSAYAVSFAVPSDTEGLIYVYGRQSCDTRRLEGGEIDVGNRLFGGQEAVIIFDDVFVPWERVFLYRESEFARVLVERFAAYHRQSYGGCKAGVGDVLIGATLCAAEYNGVARASHIKDKIVEMIHLNETIHAAGLACSSEGKPTASGTYLVDLLLANVCKLNVTRIPYEMARLAEDVAGGLLVTLPSEKDLANPEVGPLLDKYLRGVSSVPTAHRVRILRLIENLCLGLGAVGYRTESLHGAGSPQAQRIMISRLADLEGFKRHARILAGIEEHPDLGELGMRKQP